jgi:hypothetical protein
MRYLLYMALPLLLCRQSGQANPTYYCTTYKYSTNVLDSIYTSDSVKLNASTTLVRRMLKINKGLRQADFYLLGTDTVRAEKSNTALNTTKTVLETASEKPQIIKQKVYGSLPALATSPQNEAITPKGEEQQTAMLSLPFIQLPADSVAYYMELLRRLGNKEDISDMLAERATASASKLPQPYEPPSTPINAEKMYVLDHTFLPDERNKYLQMIDEIDARKIALSELYKQDNSTIAKSQILEKTMRHFTESVVGNFINYINNKIISPPNTLPSDDVAYNKYFVVSLLHDFGFVADYNTMRYAAARTIAKSLAADNALKYCKNFEELNAYLSKKGKGLYIISYDKYVALAWNAENEIYLMLADPLANGKVQNTPLKEAMAFQKYVPYFNVGTITSNTELMKNWLLNTKIVLQK